MTEDRSLVLAMVEKLVTERVVIFYLHRKIVILKNFCLLQLFTYDANCSKMTASL